MAMSAVQYRAPPPHLRDDAKKRDGPRYGKKPPILQSIWFDMVAQVAQKQQANDKIELMMLLRYRKDARRIISGLLLGACSGVRQQYLLSNPTLGLTKVCFLTSNEACNNGGFPDLVWVLYLLLIAYVPIKRQLSQVIKACER
jgi:hypothetical protein